MQDKIKEMAEFVTKHKGKEVTVDNIDDFVCSTEEDPQTIIDNIKAKENSYEDTLDLCKKIYRKKAINLETYLGQVRELADEQFLQIALRLKIQKIMKTKF